MIAAAQPYVEREWHCITKEWDTMAVPCHHDPQEAVVGSFSFPSKADTFAKHV